MGTFRLEDYPVLKWPPDEDQEEAIRILPSEKGFINADVTGKGKTYATLCAFAAIRRYNPDFHLLVLGTKSALISWESDIKNGTHFSHKSFMTSTPERNFTSEIDYDITVMTYSSAQQFPDYLQKLFESRHVVVAADEFHRAANPKSRVGKLTRYIRGYARYFWGLTATPVGNHMESLFNLVDVVKPEFLGYNWPAFLRKYCVTRKVKKPVRGRRGANRFRLVTEILSVKPCLAPKLREVMFRRDLDVEVKFHRITVPQDPDEERLYHVAASGKLGVLQEKTLKQFSARLPDLQLVVNNSADGDKIFNDDYTTVNSKEKRFLELLNSILGEGHPAVVFTSLRWSQKRMKNLCTRVFPASRVLGITGSSTEKQRDEVVKTFRGSDILLMTPAGGESLNLQASGSLVFFDLPFDLRQFVQAAGRVVRKTTQFEVVNIYIMEALGTIDSYKSLSVFANSDLFVSVMRGTSTLPPSEGKVSKDLLKKMRRSLLWRAKELGVWKRASL